MDIYRGANRTKLAIEDLEAEIEQGETCREADIACSMMSCQNLSTAIRIVAPSFFPVGCRRPSGVFATLGGRPRGSTAHRGHLLS
jgi:hypothetical protein